MQNSSTDRLTTDHINYLIFRYLQEEGFETTALTFANADWKRPSEAEDPEEFPFAPVVQSEALRKIIRDGLEYDFMRGQVIRRRGSSAGQATGRQHRIASPEAQIPGNATPDKYSAAVRAQDRVEAEREQAAEASRKLSGDATLSQVAKRGKKDSDAQQANGAQTDEASIEGDGEDTEMAETETTAAAEDPTLAGTEAPVDTYDYDNATTQTVATTARHATEAVCWKINGPQETIVDLLWSPSVSHSEVNTILTAGEAMCKLRSLKDVTQTGDDGAQVDINELDCPEISESLDVSSAIWHPSGKHLTVAAASDDTQSSLYDISTSTMRQALPYKLNIDAGFDSRGTVVRMAYSGNGLYLSTLQQTESHSKVVMYETGAYGTSPALLGGRSYYDSQCVDQAWVTPGCFLVCGTNGLLQAIKHDSSVPYEALADGTIQGMQAYPLRQSLAGEPLNFRRIVYDSRTGIAACTAESGSAGVEDHASDVLALFTVDEDNIAHGQDLPLDIKPPLHDQITGLALNSRKSSPTASDPVPSLIAVSLFSGRCIIYNVTRLSEPSNETSGNPITYTTTEVSLTTSQALTLAWSPNGRYLALGGSTQVLIYDFETFPAPGQKVEPCAKWDPSAFVTPGENGSADIINNMFSDTNSADSGFEEGTNGSADGDEGARHSGGVAEPKLCWSANGKWLAYGGDKTVAAVAFDPPLEMGNLLAETDGEDAEQDVEMVTTTV